MNVKGWFSGFVVCAVALAGAPRTLLAQPAYPSARASSVDPTSDVPAPLRGIGIDQRLGEQIPLDATFRDEAGRVVRLGDYFGSKPVLLSLAYFECPMLCTQVLNGLVSSLRPLTFDVGKEFTVLTVSFDARDTAEAATRKKATYVTEYKRPGAADGWHFLTGDEASIRRLTEAVGFKYAWDEATRQFVHATGVMVLTPDGRLARYFYGIEFAPRDLRFGLIEAAGGRIGSRVDQVLLACYHYDPSTGKYSLLTLNLVRAGGILTLIALGTFMLVSLRRERRTSAEARSPKPEA